MRSKITAAVDEYIAAHAGSMSQREIADACGLAPSTVSRRLRALRAEGAPVAIPEGKPVERNGRGDGEDGRMARLVELRDILYGALLDATPGNLARIAAEYRDVLDEIDRIERREGGGDGGDDAFDEIAAGFRALAGKA